MRFKAILTFAILSGVVFENSICLARDVGQFIHVTDFHYDSNYSQFGNLNQLCHLDRQPGPDVGKFGNLACDAPWILLKSAINAMRNFVPDADFILWTGDTAPHIADENTNTGNVIATIREVSDLLHQKFPNANIIPVIGNHDYWKNNQLIASSNLLYVEVAKIWEKWLGQEAAAMFKEHGYYTIALTGRTNAHIMSLNTNLYYASNNAVSGADPGGQFAYMQETLNQAVQTNATVFIAAHIPPGRRLKSQYNARLLEILRNFSHVIKGMFFGHMHSDQFQLLKKSSDSDETVNVLLTAPAVMPADNPAFRAIHYDRITLDLIDLTQFWLNLTKANQEGQDVWEKQYDFAEIYNTSGINAESMAKLLHEMKTNTSVLTEYVYKYNVNKPQTCTSHSCQQGYLCEVEYIDHDKYNACLRS